MKKIIALMLSIVLCAALFVGCGSGTTPTESQQTDIAEKGNTELVIFAAASMTETLTEIADLYKESHPEITLTYNFDSSGTLKTQIEEGAVCDLFVSAATKQMDQLDITADKEKNEDGLDFVLSDSRCNLLENKVALCVPENNPKNINSFDDLKATFEKENILFGMGNEDVPVGQYTEEILENLGLDEEELAKKNLITYGSNVKEVTSFVKEGSVDAAVIYQSDAISDSLKIADIATEDLCKKAIYPAAVMKNSDHVEEAQAFLDFLKTDACSKIFEKVGFTPLS